MIEIVGIISSSGIIIINSLADGAFVPPQQPQFQQQQQQYVPQHPLPPPAFQNQQFQIEIVGIINSSGIIIINSLPIQPVQFVNGGFQMPPQPNNFAANPNRFEADGAFVPPQQPQFQQQQQQYVPQHPLPPPAFQNQQFQPHAHMPPQQIQQQQQQRPLINDWMEHYLGGDGFVNFGDFHDVPQAQPQQNQQQQPIHQIPPPAAIPLPPYPQQFPPPAQDIPLPPYPPPPPQQEQLGDNFIGRNLGGNNNNVENAFQGFNNNYNVVGAPQNNLLGAPNMPIHID
uniref:Uncharacterized protein n=1 Tax=Meloidogyne incognita TaxID=6306 RepID=A0A914LQX5_MELIC